MKAKGTDRTESISIIVNIIILLAMITMVVIQ